jgi:hypothetical protein
MNAADIANHIKNIKQIVEKMSLAGKGISPDFHAILAVDICTN